MLQAVTNCQSLCFSLDILNLHVQSLKLLISQLPKLVTGVRRGIPLPLLAQEPHPV